MSDNNNNEGMVNNSNQPSQTEKFNGMINKRVTDLTEQLGKNGNEINELKQINVTDEVTKIVVGSTEFNIEDFMSEPDIHKYRNWLELKKDLESKSEDDIEEMVEMENENDWDKNFQEFIQNNYSYSDIGDLDYYYDFYDFVSDNITNSDCGEIDNFKEHFMSDKTEEGTLEEYITKTL